MALIPILTLIVALVLSAGLVADFWVGRRRAVSGGGQYEPWAFLGGVILIGVGAVTALQQIIPPADSGVAAGWQVDLGPNSFLGVLRNLTEAYVSLPKWDGNFWNHPVLFERPYGPLTWIGSGLVAAYVGFLIYSFARRPLAGWVFAAGSLGLLVLFQVKYAGAVRHHGMLFVILVVAAWLARNASASARSGPDDRVWSRGFSSGLTFLFGLHAAAGGLAAAVEVTRPFSQAGAVAEFLQQDGYAESLLVGHVDYTTIAILAGSPQRQIFYPQAGRAGSYIIWDQRRLAEPTAAEVIEAARALPRRAGQRVILILNYRLGEAIVSTHWLRKVAEFTGAIVEDENFFLYEPGAAP